MNKRQILGLAAAVLAGICTMLAYQLRVVRQQLESQQPIAAPATVPGLVQSSQRPSAAAQSESSSTSNAEPATEPAAVDSTARALVEKEVQELVSRAGIEALMAARSREELNDLPSWLYLTEAQKDELAPLWSVQMRHMGNGTPQALEQHKLRQQEAARQIEQLLGPQLHALWREYQDTAGARSQLRALNTRLGEQALPERTIRSLAAEMRRATRELEDASRAKWLANSKSTLASLDEDLEVWRRIQELRREAVKHRLTAQQLEILDEVQKRKSESYERSLAQRRAALMAAREFAVKDDQTPR